MNTLIIDQFTLLANQLKAEINIAPSTSIYTANMFRLKSILNAIDIISKYPHKITSGNQLADIKGIGKGTIDRIDEILKTGKLKEIKKNKNKYSEYVEKLVQVHGIGQSKAYELVTKYNIKNVDDLKKQYKKGNIELNNVIITGLKYYDVYKENIPRKEIDQIYILLKKIAKKIDSKLKITICGSYRRGKDTSNDIDILIAHPNIKTKSQLNNQHNFLLLFTEQLKKEKFLIDDLTDKDYKIKYMGYAKYNNTIRRIDIRYIPYESLPTALLYFTGSAQLNKKMRSLAEQLGYILNEYGLYKLADDKKIRIKINTEKDVFEKLGMEYLEPEKRN